MKPQIRAWLVILFTGAAFVISNVSPAAGFDRHIKIIQANDGYGDFQTLFIDPGSESADRELTKPPVLNMSGKDSKPLDWAIPETRLPGNFTWLAVMLDTGSRIVLNQVAALAVTTPIPSAALLLGSGIICLIGLRRRDRSQA